MFHLDSKNNFILTNRDFLLFGLPIYYVQKGVGLGGNGTELSPFDDFDQCHINGFMRPGLYYIADGVYTAKTGSAIINLQPHVQIIGNLNNGIAGVKLDCTVNNIDWGITMEYSKHYTIYKETFVKYINIIGGDYGFHNNPFSAYSYDISYCTAEQQTSVGFLTGNNKLTNCSAFNCSGDGFMSSSTWWGENGSTFQNCLSQNNTGNGFTGSIGFDAYSGCISENNDGWGYYDSTTALTTNNSADSNILGSWGGSLPPS